VHDVATFLREYPPFDALSDDDLATVSRAVEIEFFAVGALISAQGATPADSVRVVRRGAVELVVDDRPFDLLGEGEAFGHASMLSGLPQSLGARAAEDTLLYRIPETVMAPLLSRPEGMRFVARSLDARRGLDPARVMGGGDPVARRAGDLLRSVGVTVEPATTICDAARAMTAANATSAVIPLRDGTLGILTDRDLRRRVIAEGRSTDDPVSSVMSAPAYTVTADRAGSEVLLEMLDRGVRHFPVLDARGSLLGVLSDTDLMAVEARAPFHLRSAIARGETIEAVQAAARRLPETIIALWDAQVAPAAISATISVVLDALTRRLLDLTVAQHGPQPAPFSWLALGSHARRECVPSSDLDSAVLWHGDDEDPIVKGYVRAVARDVVAAQEGAGFPPCDKGASASRPLFSRSLDAWRAAAESWLESPDQESALILVSVVIDSRPVWGLREGAPLAEAFRNARDSPRLLRGLVRFALVHRPPTGFLRDIVVEHSGEHRGKLDIKGGGLLPITDIARYVGMAAGVTGASTRERLSAAAAAGILGANEARTLEEAFDLFSGTRMEHQVEQLREGRPPDDFLDLARLNALNRCYLKDAFRAVASIQKSLQNEINLRIR
jgi:CBS domain-containing protein